MPWFVHHRIYSLEKAFTAKYLHVTEWMATDLKNEDKQLKELKSGTGEPCGWEKPGKTVHRLLPCPEAHHKKNAVD